VQFPGHEYRLREPLITEITLLADGATEALLGCLGEKFALFGHSMGAIVAFEVARRLRDRGCLASSLWVAGAPAPHLPARLSPLHLLPDAVMIAGLETRYGPLPEQVKSSAEMMAVLTPVIRADLRAVETYTYEMSSPLDVPIYALGGSDDPTVAWGDLSAWQAHTRAAFTCRMFSGGHFFVESSRREIFALLTRGLR
jgi:medium-chain acyl-[acyl-carrier-protein] hydrolase